MKHALALLLAGLLTTPLLAQETPPEIPPDEVMDIEVYEPRSTLVVPAHPVTRAKYPFVDVHAHQWRAAEMTDGELDSLVAAMDRLHMAVMVNLSGGTGERLKATVDRMKGRYPNRFVVFANIDFDGIGEPGWTERAVARLEEDVRNGAQGLKIFKNLGLFLKDSQGRRVPTDDPRLDPIWAKCGELGIPVLIHTADPAPFWQKKDRFNERYLELRQRPRRYYAENPEIPPWDTLIAEQHRVFRRHPQTTFINAHLGWLGHDLARLGRLLDELPNVYTELGAVLAELGRQPRTARAWLLRYKDRVLMGKDAWGPEEYHVYFRTFETADEFFDYYRKRHAHWKMYGLDLPDDVLRHVYYRNALRIIPGLDASLFPE
ncbi:MAG: hypothetical protein KatS3mg042_0718 [Rhodothermaceae bacterium]|nr:MAG: hypothetical protein KatS3mg042_0718 [Rhodothermaceae bacterium]